MFVILFGLFGVFCCLVLFDLHRNIYIVTKELKSCYTLNPKLLVQGEVISSCQGICRTAAQVALVEDGEATVLRTQIHYLLGSLALPG